MSKLEDFRFTVVDLRFKIYVLRYYSVPFSSTTAYYLVPYHHYADKWPFQRGYLPNFNV